MDGLPLRFSSCTLCRPAENSLIVAALEDGGSYSSSRRLWSAVSDKVFECTEQCAAAPATHHLLAHDVRPIDPAQLTTNFNRRYALCIQKLYHWPHFTVSGSWNKSLHLQELQRCYCENAGSTISACSMLRHCSITYAQSLRAIYGLLAVGRVGNLLCGRATYHMWCFITKMQLRILWKLSWWTKFKADAYRIVLFNAVDEAVDRSTLETITETEVLCISFEIL
jgi:hypothetical protein